MDLPPAAGRWQQHLLAPPGRADAHTSSSYDRGGRGRQGAAAAAAVAAAMTTAAAVTAAAAAMAAAAAAVPPLVPAGRQQGANRAHLAQEGGHEEAKGGHGEADQQEQQEGQPKGVGGELQAGGQQREGGGARMAGALVLRCDRGAWAAQQVACPGSSASQVVAGGGLPSTVCSSTQGLARVGSTQCPNYCPHHDGAVGLVGFDSPA